MPLPQYFGLPVTYDFQATGPGPYHFYTRMLTGSGMTLTDHGDGIADISGALSINVANMPCPSLANGGCQLWVSNDGTETFTLDAHHASAGVYYFQTVPPSATITSPTNLLFPVGLTSTFTIKSEGAITPVHIIAPCGLSSWLSLTDHGDGTATLAGTPPRGSVGNGDARIIAHADGTYPDSSCQQHNFHLPVDATLRVLTNTDTGSTFVVGQPGSFAMNASTFSGDFIADTPLPSGLSLVNDHYGNGTLTGTPAVGTGGEYLVHYHVTDAYTGTITPVPIKLRIGEGPSAVVPPTVYLMAGVPGVFAIDPKGYPKDGMSVRLQPGSTLPPGMTGSDVTTISEAGGTAFVRGTPALSTAGHDYPLTYLIANTYGQTTVSTNLHIVPAGDVTRDNKVDCADVTAVKSRIGAKAGTANYLAAADVNSDGVIDVRDLAFVSSKLAAGTVCH